MKRAIKWGLQLLLCCLLLSSSLLVVHAEMFSGKGVQYEPYLIESYEDLCALRDAVDSGNDFSGQYFKQTADIAMPEGTLWNGIGDAVEAKYFSGIYNGNGHTISNLNCDEEYAGLFSLLNGQVWNLGIESGTIHGACVGAITSHGSGNVRIINCYSKATVIGTVRAGGFTDNCGAVILYCWNLGNVQGTSEGVATAGISSYGNASIYGCYTVNDKLVDTGTFTGFLSDSQVIDGTSEELLNDYYEKLWNDYCQDSADTYSIDDILADIKRSKNTEAAGETFDPMKAVADIQINRENIVFLTLQDGEIRFDRDYEPDLFAKEKEINRKAFLETYEKRYSFAGDGTEKNPFQISSYEDLCLFRDCVNLNVSYRGYYFTLTDDIYFPEYENWKPVGNPLLERGFSGNLDGAGHCLYGIHSTASYAGLFGYLKGTVRNLGIESGQFSGSTVGSITSHGSSDSKIINCYNKAEVQGICRAGGICDNNDDGLILYCCNLGPVSKLEEGAVIAGLCSYGEENISYSYCVNEDIVYDGTFSGTVANSGKGEIDEIAERLDEGYSKVFEYENQGVAASDIVPMKLKQNQLGFSKGHLKQHGTGYAYIPLVVLLLSSVAFCIKGILLLPPIDKSDVESCSAPKATGKIYLKHVLACGLTSLLIVGSVFGITETLLNKDPYGITPMRDYYKQKDKVDVLLLGSSRMGMNIDGEVLWNEYGIYSYNLWGSAQPFWNTYYFLEEAIRVNKPKVAVLDVTAAVYRFEDYHDEYRQITNTLGIRNLNTRFRATLASCPMESLTDYMFKLPMFHQRVFSLTQDDFSHYPWTADCRFDKGFFPLYGEHDNSWWESGIDVVSYAVPVEKEQFYLDKIVSLCKAEEIPIVFIKTQTLSMYNEQAIYNGIEFYAEENQIPFLNLNFLHEEIGFMVSDYYTDGHVNTSGARKNSHFLGQYLKENYDIEDRRSDEDSEWRFAAAKLQNRYIKVITNSTDYLSELERDNKKTSVIYYKKESFAEENEMLQKQLEAISGEMLTADPYEFDTVQNVDIGEETLTISQDFTKMTIEGLQGKKLSVQAPGIVIIVYDETFQKIVDVAYINASTPLSVQHIF